MRITAQSPFAVTHSLAVIYHVCPAASWVVCRPYKPRISHTGPNRASKKSLLWGKICLCPLTDRIKKKCQVAMGKIHTFFWTTFPPSDTSTSTPYTHSSLDFCLWQKLLGVHPIPISSHHAALSQQQNMCGLTKRLHFPASLGAGSMVGMAFLLFPSVLPPESQRRGLEFQQLSQTRSDTGNGTTW